MLLLLVLEDRLFGFGLQRRGRSGASRRVGIKWHGFRPTLASYQMPGRIDRASRVRPCRSPPGLVRRSQAADRSRLYGPRSLGAAARRPSARRRRRLAGLLPVDPRSVRRGAPQRGPVKNRAWFKTSPSWVVLARVRTLTAKPAEKSAENRQKVARNGAFFEGLKAPFRPARSRSRWSKQFICGTLCRWGPAGASHQKTRQSAGGRHFRRERGTNRRTAGSPIHPSSFILVRLTSADPHRGVMPSPNREAPSRWGK